MSAEVTGRFAPTPSGRLHLGNLLCCLLAYLSARSKGGRFLLRIEDLDVPRCPRRLSDQCIEDLLFLGFDWDEEPLYQSRRTDVYERYLGELEQLGLVYPCFCTRAQLHAAIAPNLGDRESVYSRACANLSADEIAERRKTRCPALRLRVPDEVVSFEDGHFGPVSEHLSRDCGDYIIRRSDGLFGYQLAVVIDDALSGVNEIVRGRDILFSTPRQMHLQRTLGFDSPSYFHIPLLMDAHGRRLAKRDKDLDLTALSKIMTPEQILGMLACSAGVIEENRPASLDELVKAFNWQNVKTEDIRLAYNPQAMR
ncbi:MAG: tRNA glutamyl-Q(34) synthetase GluQRS [Clostridiales bacterium]|nr:tRNA glutamyl-Q(34) synthetase GluQRS [Clostridiales bacterium]